MATGKMSSLSPPEAHAGARRAARLLLRRRRWRRRGGKKWRGSLCAALLRGPPASSNHLPRRRAEHMRSEPQCAQTSATWRPDGA
jgi:hypothetical protein